MGTKGKCKWAGTQRFTAHSFTAPPREHSERLRSGFRFALVQVTPQNLVDDLLNIGEEEAARWLDHRHLGARMAQRRGNLVPAVDGGVCRKHDGLSRRLWQREENAPYRERKQRQRLAGKLEWAGERRVLGDQRTYYKIV